MAFLLSYEIHDRPIAQKYKTQACKYYRRKLANIVQHETPSEDAPSKEEGQKIEDDDGKFPACVIIEY